MQPAAVLAGGGAARHHYPMPAAHKQHHRHHHPMPCQQHASTMCRACSACPTLACRLPHLVDPLLLVLYDHVAEPDLQCSAVRAANAGAAAAGWHTKVPRWQQHHQPSQPPSPVPLLCASLLPCCLRRAWGRQGLKPTQPMRQPPPPPLWPQGKPRPAGSWPYPPPLTPNTPDTPTHPIHRRPNRPPPLALPLQTV